MRKLNTSFRHEFEEEGGLCLKQMDRISLLSVEETASIISHGRCETLRNAPIYRTSFINLLVSEPIASDK